MSYLRFGHLVIVIILALTLAACDGSGGNSDNFSTTNDPSGQYDLVDYIFNESLSVLSNSVNYTVTLYDTSDGHQVFQYIEKFEKTADDTIYWTTDDTPASTFVITSSSIDETVHSANDELRISQRYVDVGTEYMNETTDTLVGAQNATCQVVNHHPTIDLSTLTGTFPLASGIYNDVLEVKCITGFVVQATLAPHTNLTHYFAKGVGLIFTEGELLLFGNVYIVPAL
ncbi:hypothetical protein [Kaarinaea lacus]